VGGLHRTLALALTLCLLLLAAACSDDARQAEAPTVGRRIEGAPLGPNTPGEPRRSEAVLEVVATTSVVADWLRVIGSTNVRTHVVVKAGLDPLSYLTTPNDVEAIRQADLVVAFGRGLEPWLDGVRKQGGGTAAVLTLTDGLPERTTASGVSDPFAWLDVGNAKRMVAALAAGLAAAIPADKPAFDFARDAYAAQLDRADEELRRLLTPVSGRGLVTAKETFGWFAARYGLEVVGTVVPSTSGLAEPAAIHLSGLLQAVQAKQVKAIFAERSVPDGSVRTLARDAGVKAVVGADALVGDGLGPAGTDTDTFLGALRHNGRSVASNLA
jgi:ABC-type Zn uptake system ZnuABC Zn-binding protein ZnuA